MGNLRGEKLEDLEDDPDLDDDRFLEEYRCSIFMELELDEQLGAGTSLPGLVAAKLGADVTLTDNSSRLEDQGERNMMLQQLGGVNVEAYAWGDSATIKESRKVSDFEIPIRQQDSDQIHKYIRSVPIAMDVIRILMGPCEINTISTDTSSRAKRFDALSGDRNKLARQVKLEPIKVI
ncbi:uncharacterized protein A4U43_C04F7470 [Asparagus officinalis]|uniref:Uncharacterized protein n=1 Tax=Asparagus officinalis TaxID=4686 RepID=A0A5P1F4F2_ASPOF|nr:uncharacterized protein A4U43_C04F7470 [Asparagus officinalis]